ncbi:MAG TPA: MlaD family protein [Candidatus Acidoferrales bacterium]|nr:MlaD family protein [Candidatus Acidoferrales bacterium]
MPQGKQVTWAELRVGVFVLVGLVVLAVAIFYVTGVSFWGAKLSLKTYLPDVSDLQTGAPVTLSGVTIGNVKTMRINPNPSSVNQGVEIDMSIDKRYQKFIRTDAQASLATSGLLGNKYVTISRVVTGSEIQNDGTIPGVPGRDITEMVERGVSLETNLGDILNDVRRGKGTLGKFIYDPSLYNRFNETASKAEALVSNVQAGKGSIGKLVVSDDLYNRLDATAGHLQSASAAIDSKRGSLGKLIYDPAFYDKTSAFLDNSNGLLAGIRAGHGTMGKLVTDDTLFTNLRDASVNIKDLTGKMNSGQGTFGKFFTDPQLYDNMTGLTGDMRLLIGDFRKNPKKFLQIKLHIF